MRRSILPFVTACVLAAGAGVAIAGVPSSGSSDRLTVASTTGAPTTSEAATVVSVTVPATTATQPPLSAPSVPPDLSATTRPPRATSTTTSSSTPLATSIVAESRGRGELTVATVNASGDGGVATALAADLQVLGYGAVSPVDALGPTARSGVFYAPGFELEALRIREDLGWIPGDVLSQDRMPEIESENTFDLVVVIGRDRAEAPPDTEP
jgi:hypothetical protein